MKTIAILITCYNRVNTTLECLENLFNAKLPEGFCFNVYLVDDNSPDQTGKLVKENYPKVNVIYGTGNLYWSGGMRLAWEKATATKDYDFYLWLNDDTEVNVDAIQIILNDYWFLYTKNIEAIVVGIFKDPVKNMTTYSGRLKGVKLDPAGTPQKCDYITGNFVLISKNIYLKLGSISKKFTHGMGDNDYGYRAQSAGLNCYVTSQYVGYCKLNTNERWYDPNNPLIKRLKLLFAKNSGNIIEYLKFVSIHQGKRKLIFSMMKTILRLFFPKIIK